MVIWKYAGIRGRNEILSNLDDPFGFSLPFSSTFLPSPPLPSPLIIRRCSWSSARCSWGTWRLYPAIGFDGRRPSALSSSSSLRSRRRLWPPGRGRNRSGRSISGFRAGSGCTQPGFWPTVASSLWPCCGCSREWSSFAVSSSFTSILS